MKKFHFPLDRALDWRRTQAGIEEQKFETLNAGVHRIQSQADAVARERELAISRVHTAASATGLELMALDAYRKASAACQKKLEQDAAAARQQAAQQLQAVIESRRRVRLLETLRERRWKAWNIELGREIDRQADELYLLGRGAHKMEHGI